MIIFQGVRSGVGERRIGIRFWGKGSKSRNSKCRKNKCKEEWGRSVEVFEKREHVNENVYVTRNDIHKYIYIRVMSFTPVSYPCIII